MSAEGAERVERVEMERNRREGGRRTVGYLESGKVST